MTEAKKFASNYKIPFTVLVDKMDNSFEEVRVFSPELLLKWTVVFLSVTGVSRLVLHC